MIYKSLDYLPVVLYYRILETKNLQLLVKEPVDISEVELQKIWEKIQSEFQEKDNNQLAKKVLMLSKQYDYYILIYNWILIAVESLTFEYNEQIIKKIRSYGFIVSKANYHQYLINIKNDSEGFIHQANIFKNQLPKAEENKSGQHISTEEVLASFTTILGYNIGSFMSITCSEFIAYKKQVEIKVKQMEKQVREYKNQRIK